MGYKANIIYFSSRRDAEKVASALSEQGFEAKLHFIKKCSGTEDLSDYFVFDRKQLGTLEKNYLRDSKTKPVMLLSIQKIILERLLSEISAPVFVEENFSPESFYLKKALFRQNITFFSFGRLSNDSGISIVKGALDIGFHEASFLYHKDPGLSARTSKMPEFPEFNGLIALDSPPDSVPLRYLHYFRYPERMTRGIIAFYDAVNDGKRHEKVAVYTSEHASDQYAASERASQFAGFLGNRGRIFSDFSELPYGTTVLTWSTKRFFSLLQNGFRAIPAAKCLAALAFSPKTRTLSDLLLSSPEEERFLKVKEFLALSELKNFKFTGKSSGK